MLVVRQAATAMAQQAMTYGAPTALNLRQATTGSTSMVDNVDRAHNIEEVTSEDRSVVEHELGFRAAQGDGDERGEAPWSEEGASDGGSISPHDRGRDHRSSLESSGDAAGDSLSRKWAEDIRVRVHGRLAGLVQTDRAGST
jgi:hypothetical protein